MFSDPAYLFFFFFNDTATTEIYTLSLHDALPICMAQPVIYVGFWITALAMVLGLTGALVAPFMKPEVAQFVIPALDRKSTRLNSSHLVISYAVFCLKKKKQKNDRSMIIALTVIRI